MLWTPEIEGRIDFVGRWRSVKKLPGRTSKGERSGPPSITWDKLLLTFPWAGSNEHVKKVIVHNLEGKCPRSKRV